MNQHTFKVIKYRATLARELSAGFDGICFYSHIVCYGEAGEHMIIYFLKSEKNTPENTANKETKRGTMFVPAAHFPWYIDLLRNEKPIYATINFLLPNYNKLHTSQEPVGEGEVEAEEQVN